MNYVELRALTHQCVRLGTFFYLVAEDEQGLTMSSGRDEYHLTIDFEPGERMAALGRVCIVQFDAGCLGRTDHGVLPAMPVAQNIRQLRIRTNHAQTPHDLARNIYVYIHNNHKGYALRLDDMKVGLSSPEAGQFILTLYE